MTRLMYGLALLGTSMMLVALSWVIWTEPSRQIDAKASLYESFIDEGATLYAHNCAACHGASGEGIAAYPPLKTLASMDAQSVYKTIERGRYGTAMAAFGVDEGGVLGDMQVESLVVMLQSERWDDLAVRVAALGLTPPQISVAEIPAELLTQVEALPDGAMFSAGLNLYVDHCAACHGANGEGSSLAPPLNTDELRVRLNDTDLQRILSQGISGTLMASWDKALDSVEQQTLISFVGRWGELNALGVRLPVVESAPIDNSPEALASGQRLFNLLCTQCHGTNGYGSPIAPALNNQTFLSQTSDAAIQQIITSGVTGTSMPSWGGYLSEADIADITVYLRSLQANAPVIAPAKP